MSPKKEPFISKEFMEWLDSAYPERCPNIMDTERQIWMYSGKRALVLALKHIYDRQKANDNIPIH